MIRLLIVDEQKSIREKLISLLAKEEIKILATAANGKVALEKMEKLCPDVVLMDLYMPVMDGVTATQIISQRYPQTKILILTSSNKNQNLNQALVAGAKGYLLKTAPREDIIAAINAVYRGCVYFGPHVWQVPSKKPNSQLESWTHKLAQQVIISWRSETLGVEYAACEAAFPPTQSEQKPISTRDILAILRLTNNQSKPIRNSFFNSPEKANLLLQLKLQIKKLKNNCEQENTNKLSEKLESIVQHIVRQVKENFISNKYDDLTPNYFLNFQFNAHEKRNKTIQNFQEYLSNHWQTAAPKNLLSCLENLERVLNQRHQQYQKAKKQYLNRVNTVWRTYLYLEERIKKNYLLKKTSKKIYDSHDWQAIWGAGQFC